MLTKSNGAGEIVRRALPIDTKALSEEGIISGYASRFDEVDSYGDVIAKGAFKKSLKKTGPIRVKMLYGHDPQKLIGKWTTLEEDGVGLAATGQVFKNLGLGEEALFLIKEGVLDGLSIGFRIVNSDRQSNGTRTIREIDLMEVSIVSIPALASARITNVRADGLDDFEARQRDEAAAFIAACRKAQAALVSK